MDEATTTLEGFYENLLETTGNFLPGVLGALAVLIIGWFIAGVLRRLTVSVLKKTDLDNRIFKGASSNLSPERFIAKLVYYLVLMIVLMVVLEMLGIHNVLDPIKNMVGKFMDFVPNIIGAGIIGFAGYIIATIASEVVGFFKEMLTTFINAIPNILVAGIIITVFYVGGRFLKGIVQDLLAGFGTDKMAQKLNITGIIGENTSLSGLIANLAFFFFMFTGIVAGVEKLQLPQLSAILNNILELSAQIFFGLAIMAVGNWIAGIAYNALSKTENNGFLASLARIAVLGLFLAIALRTMGIANDIVNLAFGLTLGSVAVAVALSFGLGGREAAGKQMEHILSKFRKNN